MAENGMDIHGIGYSTPRNTMRSDVKPLIKKEIVARAERQGSCSGRDVECLQVRE